MKKLWVALIAAAGLLVGQGSQFPNGGGGGSVVLPGINNCVVVMSSDHSALACSSGFTWTSNVLNVPGDVTITGSFNSGSGSGVAGASSWSQGTAPAAFPSNSFSFFAPTSIPTAYRWRVPTADAAGLIASDGGGTPGVLSIKTIQGTDTKILSSGTISGTSAPLCTTALGGATTTSCLPGLTRPTVVSSEVSHTGDTAEADLQTTTIAGGTFIAGDLITISGHISNAAGTNAVGRVKWGSTTICASFLATAFIEADFYANVYIIDSTHQKIGCMFSYGSASTNLNLQDSWSTPTEDLSMNLVIKTTGQLSGAGGTITGRLLYVKPSNF